VLGSVLVALVGVIWWFFTAPIPRYRLGFLIAFASLLLCLAAPVFNPSAGDSPTADTRLLQAGLGLVLLASVLRAGVGLYGYGVERDWPVLPQPQVSRRLAEDGSSYYVPVHGDQCWAAPRPCTPATSPDIWFEQMGMWTVIRSGGHPPMPGSAPR
jgi:hypothetical protein